MDMDRAGRPPDSKCKGLASSARACSGWVSAEALPLIRDRVEADPVFDREDFSQRQSAGNLQQGLAGGIGLSRSDANPMRDGTDRRFGDRFTLSIDDRHVESS